MDNSAHVDGVGNEAVTPEKRRGAPRTNAPRRRRILARCGMGAGIALVATGITVFGLGQVPRAGAAEDAPAIAIADGFPADQAVAGQYLVEVGTAVTVPYVVTNTGNVAVYDIAVTSALETLVTCPAQNLEPGQAMTCTAEPRLTTAADLGSLDRSGSVSALAMTTDQAGAGAQSAGPSVSDAAAGSGPTSAAPSASPGAMSASAGTVAVAADTGPVPGFTVVDQLVSSLDITEAADPDGGSATQPLAAGAQVRAFYQVSNTGQTPLADVTVTSQLGVEATCPQTRLEVGATMVCATGTRAVGPDELEVPHAASVTATGPDGQLTASVQDSVPWPVATNAPDVGDTLPDTGAASDEADQPDVHDQQQAPDQADPADRPGAGEPAAGQGDPGAGNAPDQAQATDPATPDPAGPGAINLLPAMTWPDANRDGMMGVGETVSFTYTVTNTGDAPLVGIAVESQLAGADGATITCPTPTLEPGESQVCTRPGRTVTAADARAGQVADLATVTAQDAAGAPVSQQVGYATRVGVVSPLPRTGTVDAPAPQGSSAGEVPDSAGQGTASGTDTPGVSEAAHTTAVVVGMPTAVPDGAPTVGVTGAASGQGSALTTSASAGSAASGGLSTGASATSVGCMLSGLGLVTVSRRQLRG